MARQLPYIGPLIPAAGNASKKGKKRRAREPADYDYEFDDYDQYQQDGKGYDDW